MTVAPDPTSDGHRYPVRHSTEVYRGRLVNLRRDEVVMPGGDTASREVLEHPGAVVIAPVDEDGRVVLVRQFRHPIRRFCLELPAGLLDVEHEQPLAAARRELAEETGLLAATWHRMLDLATSPGISDEIVHVFLAQDLTDVAAAQRYVAHGDEEAELSVLRVDLDRAVAMAYAGELENAATVAGVFAAARALEVPVPLRPPIAE